MPELGAFVVMLGPDTVAVERYTRTAHRLVGELVIREPRTATRRYTAELAPDGSVRRLHAELHTIGADQPLTPYTFTDEFGRDTITQLYARDTLRESFRIPTLGPTLPLLRHSLALREQAIRYARRAGRGGTARFHLFGVGEDSVVAVEVRLEGSDSVSLHSIDGEMRAWTDREGRLLRWDGLRSTAKVVGARVSVADVPALAADFAARDRAGRGIGQLSPRDSVSLRVGGARVSVAYGRPSLRGRTAVGGVLVPWDQVWRTGANLPTRLYTDRALEIGGTRVDPGVHALYTLPTRAGWTLILNRRTGGSGRDYDPAQDVARIAVSSRPLAAPVEQLTIRMEPAGDGAGVAIIAWETTELRIPLRAL
ncbi:MAG TPA: DUF2911 domain-containing protein [Longimicrobium sp.]|jgi:hypothetical protein